MKAMGWCVYGKNCVGECIADPLMVRDLCVPVAKKRGIPKGKPALLCLSFVIHQKHNGSPRACSLRAAVHRTKFRRALPAAGGDINGPRL
jgi:hypothetical protein